MDFFLTLLAGVAQCCAAQQALNNWKNNLRYKVVEWSYRNRCQLYGLAVIIVGSRQTNNGGVYIVRSLGVQPNQFLELFDVEASVQIAEAINVVYNKYPVRQPQLLFNQNELYASFS